MVHCEIFQHVYILSNSKRGGEWRFRCANGKCLGTLSICKLASDSLIAQQASMAGGTAFITAAVWCSGDQVTCGVMYPILEVVDLLPPVSPPPAAKGPDPLGSWHFASALKLNRAVALLPVLNKMLFIKLSWTTLPGAASWKTRLWKAATKAMLLCVATISCILFHLFSKAEKQACLQDLVCFCTLLLSGDKWHTSWTRRAWPCCRIVVMLQLVHPSSCTAVVISVWDVYAQKPQHGEQRKYVAWRSKILSIKKLACGDATTQRWSDMESTSKECWGIRKVYVWTATMFLEDTTSFWVEKCMWVTSCVHFAILCCQ